MNTSQLLVLLILIPLTAISQKKNTQRMAKLTYVTMQQTLDVATSDRRDATIKMLNGVLEMAQEKEFIDKVNDHKNYLEKLEYFEIPKANVAILNDSLINAKNLVLEKVENRYFVKPNKTLKKAIRKYKTGIYLYLFINESNNMYLELVNYTKGFNPLSMEKATFKFDNKPFEYYLNLVKPGYDGIEFSTMETNTENFIDLFTLIRNHQGTIMVDFSGEKRNRTKTLPQEMIDEIKNIFELYSELKVE